MSVSKIDPVLYRLMGRAIAQLLANEIIGVQPMTGAFGLLPPSSFPMPGVNLPYTVDLPFDKGYEVVPWAKENEVVSWANENIPVSSPYSYAVAREDRLIWRWSFKNLADATLFKLRWVGADD